MAEKWKNGDSLRAMTEKYNKSVEDIEQLKSSSSSGSHGTDPDIQSKLNEITQQLQRKAETKSDLGLERVDNTADLEKPVSASQKQYINNTVQGMVKSEDASGNINTSLSKYGWMVNSSGEKFYPIGHARYIVRNNKNLDDEMLTLENKVNSVSQSAESKITALQNRINRLENIKKIKVLASGFTEKNPFVQKIPVDGIKSTDIVEVSFMLPDEFIKPSTVKAMKKSMSCVDRVDTIDGFIQISCYDKLPNTDFWIMLKGV